MLARKMFRDMGRRKTQFVSIFLMAFLAVYIYAGVGGEWRGLQKSAEDFYGETKLADAFLYAKSITEEQKQQIEDIPGVIAAERRMELTASADLPDSPTLTLFVPEKHAISKAYTVSGTDFDGGDTDGVWLGKRFADANSIDIGDKLSINLYGLSIEKTVRGLVYSPERVFEYTANAMTPDFSDFGYAYMSREAFAGQPNFVYTTLLLRLDGEGSLEDEILAALGGASGTYIERRDQPSVSMLSNEISQHKMMGDIFPIVFLLIALLTIMTTMRRIVNNQRVQIGTLKALGFKDKVILRHYISYGFFLALVGASLGVTMGPFTLPHLFYPSMSKFYTLPSWEPAFGFDFVLIAAGIVILCALVCFFACRKLLRETPAATLRPRSPRVFRHGLLERTGFWQRLGFNARWNIRDAVRNKSRSLMAVIGVFGCTSLVVCALSMNDAMGDLKEWQYETINRYESKLTLDEKISPLQIERIISETDGEQVMKTSVELWHGDSKKSAEIYVADSKAVLIRQTDCDLKLASLPAEGVAITEKTAEVLRAAEGDSIEWRIYGSEEKKKSKITKIYRNPSEQGISMTRAYYESLGEQFHPTDILTMEKIEDKPDGVESLTYKADDEKGWDDLTEAMYTMVYVLIIAAAVLAIVVLYNLGLLSFTEMEREMATLKVMGMKSGRLRGLLLTQNLWFSAVGFALGVPGGLMLTEAIVSLSGDEFDFPISLHLSTFVLSLLFTFGLSIFVNLLFSRKIRRLNMVETLKGVE